MAQPGPLVVDLLPVLFLLGLLPHVAQLLEDLVGGAAGIVQDGAGLGLRAGLGLFLLFLQLVPVGLGLGAGLLHLPAELGGLTLFLLHLLALVVELGQHVLKAHVLCVHAGRSVLDDFFRDAQPPRNGKGVGLAGDAHQQAIGRGQRLHVELAGGVLHPRRRHGVDL